MRACDEAGAAPPAALLAAVAAAGQAHVFRGWPELDAAGRAALVADMEVCVECGVNAARAAGRP